MRYGKGDQTRERILAKAEELFAKNGFDGTSVDSIAKSAQVNKALIYYHFKDKVDLAVSLFEQIVEELNTSFASHQDDKNDKDPADSIIDELEYIDRRKGILALMVMESLKDGKTEDMIFRCAEIVMKHEGRKFINSENKSPRDKNLYMIYEFFTGFIPLIMFALHKDKWCRYYKIDSDEATELFVEAFSRSHLATHLSDT